MSKSKIDVGEAILIVLSAIIPFAVTSFPRTIINEFKSSSLINIVYITVICLLIAYLIYKLFIKFPGCDIVDLSSFLGGNILKNIVGFVFISYFLITSAIFLRSFCESLKVVYYTYTNIIYITLLFIIAVAITNSLKFKSTIKTLTIVFPIFFVSTLLLFFGNVNHLSFERVFPILGDGVKDTFVLGLSNIGSFAGITYLYFFPPLLKDPSKFKKISILSVIFSGIFIFLCIATLLFMFSLFIETDEIMPLFIASRYIEFGSFFQRFESIFLLIWIISFCCYLSIACKFSNNIFKKIFNLKDSHQMVYTFVLLVFSISLIPKNYSICYIFETYIYRYISIAIILIGLIILILSNFKKKVGV